MYTKRNYGFFMTLNWSKKPLLVGFAYALLVCGVSFILNKSLMIPWQPVGVVGIAVAFYLGFKNNSSYDRTWEARKIWGGIVNDSRSFAAAVVSFVQGDHAEELHRELIYRHIAWLTALRHQLRLSRSWEHVDERVKNAYAPTICEDYHQRLESEMLRLVEPEELDALKPHANMATQIVKTQALRLQQLRNEGYFDDFRHMQFYKMLTRFYDGQGKSERIKNFPFPRQYASTALWLTYVFCALVPLGLIDIFKDAGPWGFWLCPLISALIIWVFNLMEMIGDYSENPFEGTYNDVPITSIARGIEIDLRQMLNETEVPGAIPIVNGFQM